MFCTDWLSTSFLSIAKQENQPRYCKSLGVSPKGKIFFFFPPHFSILPLLKQSVFSPDIRHPEELSLLRKPRDPSKKKKKKLDDQYEDEAFELEGPLITPGSGESGFALW